jgi:hypothetical protein
MQIFALLRIVQVPPCVSVQREEFPDVYLEVQHPCWSCNSNSSSANASAGVR